MTRFLLGLLLLAPFLGPPRVGAAASACTGRYVVRQADAPLIVGGDVGGATDDAVVLAGRQVAILSGCAPIAVRKLKVTKKGTKLNASWAVCGDARKVQLSARIDDGCQVMTGVWKARKAKAKHFTAILSSCGNGVVDAGEECDASPCSDAQSCGEDCTCPPPTPTTLPSSTTSTTTTTLSSTTSATITTSTTTSTAPTTTTRTTTTTTTTTTAMSTTTTSTTRPPTTTTIAATTSTVPTTTTTTTRPPTTTTTTRPPTTTTTTTTRSTTTTTTLGIAVCGNGRREGPEECDDGDDDATDACTNACRNARCGDGIVRNGVEQCDDGNTTPNDGCTGCISDPPVCGNGRIELGETCDDGNTQAGDGCPPGCRIEPCSPTATRVQATVTFDRPARVNVGGLVVFVDYPDGRVGIPGSGGAASVRGRITGTPAGFSSAPNDLDYGLRETLAASGASASPGVLFRVSFDQCAGASAPPATSFTCRVESAASPQGLDLPLTGITCAVTVP